MTDAPRPRVPIKEGYFSIPDDPAAVPNVVLSRCADCGEHFFPQRLVCGKCLSRKIERVEVPARGTLYSYTWVHMPLFGSMRIEHMEGYGVGQIDLPEGPRVQLPLAGKRDDYAVGIPLVGEVEPLREESGRDVCILRFRPAGSPS
jgi:uncharacterized OB-fold protein